MSRYQRELNARGSKASKYAHKRPPISKPPAPPSPINSEEFRNKGYTGSRNINDSGALLRFFTQGSILHTYNFFVDLTSVQIPIYGVGGGTGHFRSTNISNAVWNFPAPYQVVDVEIPSYKFQKESISLGATQFSYPILSEEQQIELKITFEDSVYGNISRFVHLLQMTVVSGDGFHNKIKDMFIGKIYVYLADEMKNSVCCWVFYDVYYLGHENLSLSYEENAAVKYTVTFGCDCMEFLSDNSFYGVGEEDPEAFPVNVYATGGV